MPAVSRPALLRLPHFARRNMVYTKFCVGNEEESLCIILKKTIQLTRPSQAINVLNRIKSSNPLRPPCAAFLLVTAARERSAFYPRNKISLTSSAAYSVRSTLIFFTKIAGRRAF